MIDLYTWKTPNGRKASIMLEEIGANYSVQTVDTHSDEQFAPAFAAISPNNKIPAIIDYEPLESAGPISIFESGAILHYLARKSGEFIGNNSTDEARILAWCFFQASFVGPNLGTLHHFVAFAEEKSSVAINRFLGESARAFSVIDTQLQQSTYIADANYTIADIMIYPWLAASWPVLSQTDEKLSERYPFIVRWLDLIGRRPAVKRGMAVPFDDPIIPMGNTADH